MKLDETIAERIGQARKAAGLSQQALGVAAGIEEETAKVRIHQYEQGKHLPPYSMLERLAKTLGKPVSWFICEEAQKSLLLVLDELSQTELSAVEVYARQLLESRTTETR
jgi:transcriptional regulator with XRE-family HTH domain